VSNVQAGFVSAAGLLGLAAVPPRFPYNSVSSTGLDTATFVPYRALAAPVGAPGSAIVATVTVREQHSDDMTITERPVEQGAAIADHAFKNPARVMIQAGWSQGDAAAEGDPNYLSTLYANLLALQESRVPFTIYTGKRIYTTMLFQSLTTETDEKTENVIIVNAVCRQVILVDAVATTVPVDQTLQATPEQTTPVLSTGTKPVVATTLYNPVTQPNRPSIGSAGVGP
jgi:hypothetical protein